jgi:hypothetical protein
MDIRETLTIKKLKELNTVNTILKRYEGGYATMQM